MQIATPRFTLVLLTRDETLAMVAAMPPEERAQVSPAWLERVRTVEAGLHWQFMFDIREDGGRIGSIGFKGPPDSDATVEIAYGIE
jgi:[ribosomal protein S5]-alanine N-acetyltransferase